MFGELSAVLFGLGIIVAVVVAVRVPGPLRSRMSLFVELFLLFAMAHSFFVGQYARAAALGVAVLIGMELDRKPSENEDV